MLTFGLLNPFHPLILSQTTHLATSTSHLSACIPITRSFLSTNPPVSATRPIAVIVCGRHEEIGRVVSAGLKPEYEVVHFVKTTEAGVKDLPSVLNGQPPETETSSMVGTGRVEAGARAVILGGGYNSKDYNALRKAVDTAELSRRPVWLRSDLTVKMPSPSKPEYGQAAAARVKKLLDKLKQDGGLDGRDTGMYWY